MAVRYRKRKHSPFTVPLFFILVGLGFVARVWPDGFWYVLVGAVLLIVGYFYYYYKKSCKK